MNSSAQCRTATLPTLVPLRILVVDDSVPFGDLAAALLGREPFVEVVGLAHNGRDALKAVAALKPDVVLMDVQMKPMSGLTAATVMSWVFPGTHVVMMSSDDSPRLRAECAAAGAKAFIHKTEFIRNFLVAVGPIARDVVRERKCPLRDARITALTGGR